MHHFIVHRAGVVFLFIQGDEGGERKAQAKAEFFRGQYVKQDGPMPNDLTEASNEFASMWRYAEAWGNEEMEDTKVERYSGFQAKVVV